MSNSSDDIVFLPLGGSGEIGMNLNLFGFAQNRETKKGKRTAGRYQWIIVDIGVTFGGPDTPGIEIIMPDTAFIEERKEDLLGIVLTHAHEDHMGALARLWPRLQCPVYATPFTMYLVKDRLAEAGILREVPLHTMPLKSRFSLGPFDLEYVTLTHSIPEPNGLAIRTKAGTIFHTGDWKIDPDPGIGEAIDEESLARLCSDGVLAMVCDSTNALSPGRAGSESDVREELIRLIGEYEGRGVAVASFASNVARLESVMIAAREHRRQVCLVGRSMRRMYGAAKAVGLLSGLTALTDTGEAVHMSKSDLLYLCTGSQGEPRAALSRIAQDDYRDVNLSSGDVVIFSSKIIPGNERNIFRLQNKLADKGVEIVTEKDRPIHVSGHPYQDELRDMYYWVQPDIAIPVHGERRHLLEHAKLAQSWGVKDAIAPHNGEMIKLSEDGPEIIDIVPSGRLHQDGHVIVADTDSGLRERRKMAYAGHVSVGLAYSRKGHIISGPESRISGFPEGDEGEHLDELLDEITDICESVFHLMSHSDRQDEYNVEDKLKRAVKKFVRERTDKRAIIEIIAHRV